MARRRMFSLDVVDTDRFLDMPSSTQILREMDEDGATKSGVTSSQRRSRKAACSRKTETFTPAQARI